jgi:hypothetical protein
METIDREIRGKFEGKPFDKSAMENAIAKAILTPEAQAKSGVTVTVSERRGYEIRTQQCPLDMYYNRKQLGENNQAAHQRYRAGDRFYREFYLSGITPGMTINHERVYSSDKRDYLPNNDRQIESLECWRMAYKAVNGEPGKYLALNVLCYAYPLSQLVVPHFKRGADAMPRFIEVLDDLVKHYFVDLSENIR